jgi:hypothetical protein
VDVPDKVKKPRRSKEKALADRVYKHYKAIKQYCDMEFVMTRYCMGCEWSTWPHSHGYNKLTTPDRDWNLLAQAHGLTVREVKDIVSRKRGWTPDKIMEDREHAIQVRAEGDLLFAEFIKQKEKELEDKNRS